MTLKQFRSAGGKARAVKLTPEQRQSIARTGAAARWIKHPPKPKLDPRAPAT